MSRKFSGAQGVEITSTRKKLTIFFSDIANFTETTDNLESEELTNLLNRYLTEMSTITLEFGGTLDKYIGDAVVVFFGDPESRGLKEDALHLAMEDGVLDELGLKERYGGGPNQAIAEFFESHPGLFEIGTEYCDMFGPNATYNPNGYLKRTARPFK